MKYIVLFLSFFIFGCTAQVKKSSYIITNQPKTFKQNLSPLVVGVEDIELPYYLEDGKIPYVKNNKIEFFNSYFTDDAEDFIKQRAIDILKNRYKDAFDYPWESKSANYLLKIHIKEFITTNNILNLKATYEFYSKNKKLIKQKFFTRSKSLKVADEKEILKAMQELFDEFINDISTLKAF